MPASAPTGRVAAWVYDEHTAQADLDALESLLATRDELSEREDILPFLRSHPHLCALIGSYNRCANTYDRLGLEVPLFGQFTADLVSGDHATRAYTLVEFEDGRPNSIFVQRTRQHTEWSPRCEHGLSQLIDWLWLLDDQAYTQIFEEIFGARPVTATVVLVIGRDRGLTASDRRRLEWRRDHVVINSQHLYCCTSRSCCGICGGVRVGAPGYGRVRRRSICSKCPSACSATCVALGPAKRKQLAGESRCATSGM